MDRKTQQLWQSRILDTATSGVVLYLLYYKPELFNPWNLLGWQWVLGAIGLRVAIAFYDHIIIFLIDHVFKNQLLPTRTADKPVRFVPLDKQSMIYLTINAIHEWIFVQRYCHFIWYSPDVSLQLQDISPLNTFVALWCMFAVNDIIYAPCHHVMHMPAFYPLVHKHHHRQHFPTRGYLDAGNEHPIEHLIGILVTWAASLFVVHGPTGVHGITLFLFFNIHATLAMLNHSPYEVHFDIIPGGILKYSVGNHEMHHRKFTVNYGQYAMWYDHLIKSFAPYEGPSKNKQL